MDVVLSSEEQAAMDKLLDVMSTIERWGLAVNRSELTTAVHGIQAFIIQHMLQRLAGDSGYWGAWYG